MKAKHVVLIIVLMAYGLTAYSILTIGHDWWGDTAGYLMQAISILNNEIQDFIVHNTFTIRESSWQMGPVTYPWGYPLLISAVIEVFGLNLIAIKSINILCYAIFLVFLFQLFSKRLALIETILLVSLFAFNPYILVHHDVICSDIAFLPFSTLSILLIDKYIVSKKTASVSEYILIGSVIFVAFFMRSNGILLLATLFISQLVNIFILHKNGYSFSLFRIAVSSIPYAVFFLLVVLSATFFTVGSGALLSFIAQVTGQSLKSNLYYYIKLPVEFFWSVPHKEIIYIFTLPFFITGLFSSIKYSYHFIAYVILSLLLFIIFPPQQGLRYIFPILVFYIYFIVIGINYLFNHQNLLRYKHVVTSIIMGGVLFFFLKSSVTIAVNNLESNRDIRGPYEQVSQDMFNYIKNYVEDDGVVIFFKPRIMRLMTNKSSIMANTCNEIYKGDYYVFYKKVKEHNRDEQMLPGAISSCSAKKIKLEQLYENRDFIVFKLSEISPDWSQKAD
jgi:hypothetical protein